MVGCLLTPRSARQVEQPRLMRAQFVEWESAGLKPTSDRTGGMHSALSRWERHSSELPDVESTNERRSMQTSKPATAAPLSRILKFKGLFRQNRLTAFFGLRIRVVEGCDGQAER
jgi:hypothetical protein